MLGVDVVVAKLKAFAKGKLQHLLGLRRKRWVTRYVSAGTTDYLSHGVSDLLEADPEGPQCPGGEAVPLTDQSEQDVFRADKSVPEESGLDLGKDEDPAGTVGEALEHGLSLARTSM